MQALLSLYYQCCYQGHWRELNEVLKYSLTNPPRKKLLMKCVKGGHQYCIADKAIKEAIKNLNKVNILSVKYNNFEVLYADVRNAIGMIKGIGDLTIYDTALRLGFIMFPIVLPGEYIYLARGAKRGAEKLLGKTVHFREHISIFTPYFGNLSNHFIEDFLCVMEDFLCMGGEMTGNLIPPAICQCRCALELKGQHPKSSNQKGSCFCSRISNETGEFKDKYIDNGELTNNILLQ